MTTANVNDALNQVVNNFTGQWIAMPNGQYSGECTAPICWYLHYLGLPIPFMANNRADGWGVVHPHELAPYFTFEDFQQGKAYPRGTILMWNSPHIALVLSDAGGDNVVTCFEQNADPDGAPCGTHSRTLNTSSHTCTYAMIPIVDAPAPVAPPAPRYTVTENYPEGKQIKLNKDCNLWGMNYSFDTMVKNPVETGHKQGEVWTVTNKVHHEDGYDYYRREGQVDGFNVLDCDDYTPPPPTPPAAPVPFPGNGTEYTVIVPLQGYQSGTQAGNHSGLAVPVEPGTYFVFRYHQNTDQLINITKDKTKPGWWINNADNVLPPEPEVVPEPSTYLGPRESSTPVPVVKPPAPTPVIEAAIPDLDPVPVAEDDDWKATYVPFNPDTGDGVVTTPRMYKVNLSGRIWNLDEKGPDVNVFISKNQHVHAYGTVVKDGTKYYRLKVKRDTHFDFWLCAPLTFDGRAVLVKVGPSWADVLFHRGQQLKSIFSSEEPKFLDIVKLEPFKKRKK